MGERVQVADNAGAIVKDLREQLEPPLMRERMDNPGICTRNDIYHASDNFADVLQALAAVRSRDDLPKVDDALSAAEQRLGEDDPITRCDAAKASALRGTLANEQGRYFDASRYFDRAAKVVPERGRRVRYHSLSEEAAGSLVRATAKDLREGLMNPGVCRGYDISKQSFDVFTQDVHSALEGVRNQNDLSNVDNALSAAEQRLEMDDDLISRCSAATVSALRGTLAIGQGRYRDASQHFDRARDTVPDRGLKGKYGSLSKEAAGRLVRAIVEDLRERLLRPAVCADHNLSRQGFNNFTDVRQAFDHARDQGDLSRVDEALSAVERGFGDTSLERCVNALMRELRGMLASGQGHDLAAWQHFEHARDVVPDGGLRAAYERLAERAYDRAVLQEQERLGRMRSRRPQE
jgi:tetratricopeptide (TPR) repeat protein